MYIKKLLTVLSAILILVSVSGCNADNFTSANEPGTFAKYGNGNSGSYELSQEEIDGLTHMRIEEKLARDVYIVFDSLYNYKVFENISIGEQTHMDAVKRLLVKYNIEDPLTTDEIGIFPDQQFQQLFDNYIIQGNISLQEALQAGVTIEEMDIADLENQLTNVVDNPDIIKVYQNLKRASENHLAAFLRCLQTNTVNFQ